MLEPDQRHIGGMLGFFDFAAPLGLVVRERARHVAAAGRAERFVTARSRLPSRAWCPSRSRNARSPWRRRSARCCRASSSRSGWSGKLRQSERFTISMWPASSLANTPSRNFADCASSSLSSPARCERLRIGLHHPGRVPGLVLIAVRDEDAVLGLLEEEREGVERPRRAHPGELIGPQIDARLEPSACCCADARIDAVGRDDQVGVAMRGVGSISVWNFSSTPSARARSCSSLSSVTREQPQKPLPPTRCTVPLKWISMSSQ